jgi:hypothetical protein
MISAINHPNSVGIVICPKQRPATPTEVWIELTSVAAVALGDLLLIESPNQQLLGIVVDVELVDDRYVATETNTIQRRRSRYTSAKLNVLSFSDGRRRPPEGTVVRRPRPSEVTMLLAEARAIPVEYRTPVGAVPIGSSFAPVYVHAHRLVGPVATSALITGAAGSLKSTAGVLLLAGIQHVLQGQCALVLVNSKSEDFLFADFSRDDWSERVNLRPLRDRDRAIYSALGYPTPPVLQNLKAFVPQASDATWRSARPLGFPRTQSYRLSQEVAIRYALDVTDEEERALSIVTKQCIEEAAGSFATERGVSNLAELVAALEAEFVQMVNDRARWRNQFQATTVAAALRQLQSTLRDLGPILGESNTVTGFPVEQLARGGTWVVDVAPLPARAAQAVLDELITALWNAKARGVISPDLPLVLLVDELNRWSATGPTASRLAAIVRDQRHRRFSLVGLAQQLSKLNEQILANADTLWLGSVKSQELADDVYNHLPVYIRNHLHRLSPGQRVIDAWPLAQPLTVEIPYPSWLIAEEGLNVVQAFQTRTNHADDRTVHASMAAPNWR